MGKLVFLDTETTGFSDDSKIIEMSLVIQSKDGFEYFSEYVNPGNTTITVKAMSIHHITPEKLTDKPDFKNSDIHKMLLKENAKDNIVIAHNATFDLGMLEKEGVKWNGHIIDTLKCARILYPNEESHSLQYLRYGMGLYKEEKDIMNKIGINTDTNIIAHNALSDVIVMIILFNRILKDVSFNVKQLVTMTSEPMIIKKFPFGIHKGSSIDDIPTDYLKWTLENAKDLDIDLRYTIIQNLSSRK